MKCTFVVVYNKENLLDQMWHSVEISSGGINCELIALNNVDGKYRSAASAFNSVLEKNIDTDVMVFCHQDIIFLEGSIDRIVQVCCEAPNALFGAAGVRNTNNIGNSNRIISRMGQGQGWNYETLAEKSIEDVFSLDECLIAANKKVFETLRFDEQVCDGWHFYAVELCLQCHVKKIGVKVFDANIVHLSSGNLNSSFYATEKRIARKYRRQFHIISYPCGWIYTNPILYRLLRIYRITRNGIKYGR